MSSSIVCITGRVHQDGGLPPAPHHTKLEYTANFNSTEGVYTVTFKVPFSEAPSVLVTPYVPNTQDDINTPLVAPTVYAITPTSFLVKFWTYSYDGSFNIFSFVARAFSFAALEITAKKDG